ncbi:MAG: hypothetical protein WCD35_18365, partial [Mycobacteriales bacterium]
HTVPMDGSVTLPYSCTFTGAPATTGKVTASVAWDAASAYTSAGSTDLPVDVALAQVGATNRTIDVVDDKTDPAHPVALGSWTFDDGAHDFTYSLTKTSVAGTCTDYTNVASIVQTEQSDSQVVTVCGPTTGGGGGVVVTPKPPTGGGGLPFTGDLSGVLGRWALAMVLEGAVLVLVGRRNSAEG